MNKWNLIVDVARCENCNNCTLAAKDELVGNEFPGYTAPHAAQGPGVMRIRRRVRGATPMVDAAYVPACAITATTRRASGLRAVTVPSASARTAS